MGIQRVIITPETVLALIVAFRQSSYHKTRPYPMGGGCGWGTTLIVLLCPEGRLRISVLFVGTVV